MLAVSNGEVRPKSFVPRRLRWVGAGEVTAILAATATRWLKTAELYLVLVNCVRLRLPLRDAPLDRPPSGSWALYSPSLKVVRADRHPYVRRSHSGYNALAEHHVVSRLSTGVVSGYYATTTTTPPLSRRVYRLVDSEFRDVCADCAARCPPLSQPAPLCNCQCGCGMDPEVAGVTFVQYLVDDSGAADGPAAGAAGAGAAAASAGGASAAAAVAKAAPAPSPPAAPAASPPASTASVIVPPAATPASAPPPAAATAIVITVAPPPAPSSLLPALPSVPPTLPLPSFASPPLPPPPPAPPAAVVSSLTPSVSPSPAAAAAEVPPVWSADGMLPEVDLDDGKLDGVVDGSGEGGGFGEDGGEDGGEWGDFLGPAGDGGEVEVPDEEYARALAPAHAATAEATPPPAAAPPPAVPPLPRAAPSRGRKTPAAGRAAGAAAGAATTVRVVEVAPPTVPVSTPGRLLVCYRTAGSAPRAARAAGVQAVWPCGLSAPLAMQLVVRDACCAVVVPAHAAACHAPHGRVCTAMRLVLLTATGDAASSPVTLPLSDAAGPAPPPLAAPPPPPPVDATSTASAKRRRHTEAGASAARARTGSHGGGRRQWVGGSRRGGEGDDDGWTTSTSTSTSSLSSDSSDSARESGVRASRSLGGAPLAPWAVAARRGGGGGGDEGARTSIGGSGAAPLLRRAGSGLNAAAPDGDADGGVSDMVQETSKLVRVMEAGIATLQSAVDPDGVSDAASVRSGPLRFTGLLDSAAIGGGSGVTGGGGGGGGGGTGGGGGGVGGGGDAASLLGSAASVLLAAHGHRRHGPPLVHVADSESGETLLHLAVAAGSVDLACALVLAGAHVTAADHGGRTVMAMLRAATTPATLRDAVLRARRLRNARRQGTHGGGGGGGALARRDSEGGDGGSGVSGGEAGNTGGLWPGVTGGATPVAHGMALPPPPPPPL